LTLKAAYLERGEEDRLLEFDVEGGDDDRREHVLQKHVIIEVRLQKSLQSSSFIFRPTQALEVFPRLAKRTSVMTTQNIMRIAM
jgi:hypothetical protein